MNVVLKNCTLELYYSLNMENIAIQNRENIKINLLYNWANTNLIDPKLDPFMVFEPKNRNHLIYKCLTN